jgi:DNA-binding CsgD family transcriptional regulator
MWRGQIDQARARLSELMAIADERGQAESYFVIRLHLCELELRAGRLDAVAAWLDEWSEEAGGPLAAGAGLARCRAMLAATRGEPEEIAEHVGEAVEWSERTGDRWQWLEAHRAAGMAHLVSGDFVQAAHDLRLVWEHTTKEGVDDPGVFPVAPDLVEALIAVRAVDEARIVVAQLSRAANELDHPWARATEARCRALLRPGASESPTALERAAEAYRGLGLGFDRARTLLALGIALRSERRQDEGRLALDTAAEAFNELGASGWAERARAERAKLRGRSSVHEQLTPAEKRVARLVATGHRNREVSAQLFISEKTVEAHLSRIYTKLGVRSRTELAHRFRQAGPNMTL